MQALHPAKLRSERQKWGLHENTRALFITSAPAARSTNEGQQGGGGGAERAQTIHLELRRDVQHGDAAPQQAVSSQQQRGAPGRVFGAAFFQICFFFFFVRRSRRTQRLSVLQAPVR